MKHGIKNSAFTAKKFVTLQEVNQTLTTEVKQLKSQLDYANKVIDLYRERDRLQKLRRFGKKTEANLDGKQLTLFDDLEEEEKKPEEEKPQKETITYTRKKKTKGRRIDISKLSRERVECDLSEEEKHCAKCGKKMEKFGEDVSEQLELYPKRFDFRFYAAHLEPIFKLF